LRNFAKLVTLQLLRAYKWAVSPLFPPSCRYVPTCSEYAMEAVERFGALRGSWMAVERLLRCHPFARGGYDPVVSRGHDHAVECEIHNCEIQAASSFKKA
jgi:putative membrane protein insertion efficiency factor